MRNWGAGRKCRIEWGGTMTTRKLGFVGINPLPYALTHL